MASLPAMIELRDRGLLQVGGADRDAFLQGLITNDIRHVRPDRAIYAALLTAQGRFLHDFFVAQSADGYVIDAEGPRLDDLRRRLTIYRLRAKVTIAAAPPDMAVFALYGDGALAALDLPDAPGAARGLGGGIIFVDPRHQALGARAIIPGSEREALAELGFVPGDPACYARRRLDLAIPDGSRDLEVERALILENGFEALHGVDWQKGCYVGQEVTARMHYRALVKKRLMTVAIEGPMPEPGTAILQGDLEVGEIRSGDGGRALALVKLDAAERIGATSAPLMAGESRITLPAPPAE